MLLDVRELRLKVGLSQRELSDKTGIPMGRINNWEQGKGRPKAEDATALLEFFNTYQVKVSESPSKRIPFYDIEASGGHNGGDVTAVTQPTGTIDIGDILRDSEAALRIAGNSMMPGYPPGCVVGLIKRQSLRIIPGEVYVYETLDGRWIKRLFYKNDDPASDTYICISDSVTKFETGPREGKLYYPPSELKADEIINLFTVVGVIKRNSNGMINYKQ